MIYQFDEKFGGVTATPDCAQEWLELISNIALDYDGAHSVEDLKSLIDEMADMANKAAICIDNLSLSIDPSINAERWKRAKSELDEYYQSHDLI